MALREDQIVRYGRQILLREVGGRGQERLLGTTVRVLGSGPAIDDAVAWLLAGGTPLALPTQFRPGGFLFDLPVGALKGDASSGSIELLARGELSTSPGQVVVGAGVAYRTSAACDACWLQTLAQLAPDPIPAGAGSLAALAVQRLVLGWAEPLGLVFWTGRRFETAALAACCHAEKCS